MVSFRTLASASLLAIATSVNSETHTITFTNMCGYGTPTLVGDGGVVLSTGDAYTSNGPISAIGFLQTGGCGSNGEDCIIINTTLINPTTVATGSDTIIFLSPPYAFSVTSGFGYYNGCDGAGYDCTSADCSLEVFHIVPPPPLEIACRIDNVNLAMTFCD